jgi:hypothetical protein
MYPWRDPNGFDLGPLYSYNDAPDAISITINGDLFNAAKYSQSGLISYSGSWGGGTITIYEGEDSGSTWLLYSEGVPGDPSGESNTECLIGSYAVDNSGPGGADSYMTIVEDQFADTYTVNGPTSGTVTRKSVCVWRGTGFTLTNFGFQWKVNDNNKSSFQNTPVGSYAGGYTVS